MADARHQPPARARRWFGLCSPFGLYSLFGLRGRLWLRRRFRLCDRLRPRHRLGVRSRFGLCSRFGLRSRIGLRSRLGLCSRFRLRERFPIGHRVGLEKVAEDFAERRTVDRALAQHAHERCNPGDQARRVDDRGGDPGGGWAAVEVDGDAVAEHVLGVRRHDRRGLAGQVGAGDGERAGLLEEFECQVVGRHPHRDGAVRVTEIPGERRLRGQHDRQSAGPERLDQPLDGLRHLGHERAKCCDTRHEHGRRRLTAPALRLEEALDGAGAERVGRDAVHRVGRKDHEFAAADRLARLAHAGEQLSLVTAVEYWGHVLLSLSGGPFAT